MAESEEELNSFLRRVKEKSKKAGLNLSLKTNKQTNKLTKIMAFGPITSGKLMGKKWKHESFIFLDSKITVESDGSHEINRHLLLGRKAMTNLDSILKSRHITLPTKVLIVKAMVFQWSCMDVRVGPSRRLSTEELMLLNCGAEADFLESLKQKSNPTSQS